MQPVCDFDEDDPDVAGHGHEHLSQIFHLLFLCGGVLHPCQLGDALYQHGDSPAEVLCDLIKGGVGVFNAVVQQRAQNGVGVKTDFGHDFGHCQRMDDIGRAVFPLLVGMFFLGVFHCRVDAQHIRRRGVSLDGFHHCVIVFGN